MRVEISILFICFVDNFHIPRNFAFDTSVGPILQFTLLLELSSSLLDIIYRASDYLGLFVLIDPPIDISMLVT